MNKKLFTGLMTAIAIGSSVALAKKMLKEQKLLRARDQVNQLFSDKGEVTGTWIEEKARLYQHHNFKAKAYYGGIIRRVDGQLNQYEFVIDAKNFSLLDLKML